jgi:ABC-type sulfate transport system permease subunit
MTGIVATRNRAAHRPSQRGTEESPVAKRVLIAIALAFCFVFLLLPLVNVFALGVAQAD